MLETVQDTSIVHVSTLQAINLASNDYPAFNIFVRVFIRIVSSNKRNAMQDNQSGFVYL